MVPVVRPLFVSILLGITAWLGVSVDPWRTVDGNLLSGVAPKTRGRVTPSGSSDQGSFLIKNEDPHKNVRLVYRIEGEARRGYFRLEGDMRSLGVTAGPLAHHKACLYLYSRDKSKNSPHKYWHVVRIAGDSAWNHYHGVFEVVVPGRLSVMAGLFMATGELGIRGLRLQRVVERGGFAVLRWIVFGAWFVLGAIYFRICLPVHQYLSCTLMGVLVVLIMVGTILSADHRQQIAEAVNDTMNTFRTSFSDGGEASSAVYKKVSPVKLQGSLFGYIPKKYELVHFLLFAIATVFWMRLRQHWRYLMTLFVIAGLSEILQLFVFGRNPSWLDFGIDCMGIGCGFIAWKVTIQLLRLGQRKKGPSGVNDSAKQ